MLFLCPFSNDAIGGVPCAYVLFVYDVCSPFVLLDFLFFFCFKKGALICDFVKGYSIGYVCLYVYNLGVGYC